MAWRPRTTVTFRRITVNDYCNFQYAPAKRATLPSEHKTRLWSEGQTNVCSASTLHHEFLKVRVIPHVRWLTGRIAERLRGPQARPPPGLFTQPTPHSLGNMMDACCPEATRPLGPRQKTVPRQTWLTSRRMKAPPPAILRDSDQR